MEPEEWIEAGEVRIRHVAAPESSDHDVHRVMWIAFEIPGPIARA